MAAEMVDLAQSGKSILAKQASDEAARSNCSQVDSDQEVFVKAFASDQGGNHRRNPNASIRNDRSHWTDVFVVAGLWNRT